MFKIYDEKSDKLLAVINLNYMFPVPKSAIKDLKYSEIDQYREYSSEKQKSQYIHFLKMEMRQINKLNIGTATESLFELKCNYPQNSIAKSCIDFSQIEKIAEKYITIERNEKND